jgi:hypothetical protein
MSLLPDVIPNGDLLPPRQLAQALRAQHRAELTVFRHGLAARVQAECDRIDSQAAGDALRTALDEEVDLLDYGLRRANGSLAKAELVARKVEMLANINNRRISRRFGA